MAYLNLSPEQSSKSKKTLSDYEFLASEGPRGISTELGKGAYGSVRRVRDKQTGEIQALKIMSKKSILQYATKENLKREISIQSSMLHPNIIKLYNHFEDEENVYLVLEYAANGSLFQNLRRKKKFSEEQAFVFFLQTCLGIDYLHKRKILHRDLKPENLLLDKDFNIKLCDFGWSAENQTKRMTFCGTVDYMAPEMLKSQPYDHKLDIWCLGILLYEMLHGVAPFKGRSDREKVDSIVKNQSINFSPDISPEAVDLIRKILRPIPSERLSMDEILRHPWMQKHEKLYGTSIQALKQQQDDLMREYQMKLGKPESAEYHGTGIYDNPYLLGSNDYANLGVGSEYLYSNNQAPAYSSHGNDPYAHDNKPYLNKGYSAYSTHEDSSKNYLSAGHDQYNYKSATDPLYGQNYNYSSSMPLENKYNQQPYSAGAYNDYSGKSFDYTSYNMGEKEKKSRNLSSNEGRVRRASEEYEEARNYGARRSKGRRRRSVEQPGFWKKLLIGLGCIEREKDTKTY